MIYCIYFSSPITNLAKTRNENKLYDYTIDSVNISPNLKRMSYNSHYGLSAYKILDVRVRCLADIPLLYY